MNHSLRRLGALAAFCVLTQSSFSLAQEAESPEGTSAPAAVDSSAEQAAAGTPAQVDPYAEAKERVGRAKQLYTDGNYDAALIEFSRAYDTMLGHPARPHVLYNMGLCQEKLYRYDAAVASYREYLQIAAADEQERATVSAKIELLEGLLGTIKLSVQGKKGSSIASYEVWVDGRLVGQDTTQFLVPGGNHQIEIRAEGFESLNQQTQVASRAEVTLQFEMSPLAKEYRGIPQVYFWTGATLTGVAAIAGTTFGVMALTKRSDINTKLPAAVTDEDAEAVRRRALMADICFISAGVLGVSTAVLGFLTDWESSREQAPDSNIRVKEVGFIPTPQGGFVSVGGSF